MSISTHKITWDLKIFSSWFVGRYEEYTFKKKGTHSAPMTRMVTPTEFQLTKVPGSNLGESTSVFSSSAKAREREYAQSVESRRGIMTPMAGFGDTHGVPSLP